MNKLQFLKACGRRFPQNGLIANVTYREVTYMMISLIYQCNDINCIENFVRNH